MNIYDLPTMSDARQSFYGKAKVIDNGSEKELLSYNTIVCRYKNGKLEKLWGGYSQTTMRHIRAFAEFCGLSKLSKKEWDNMEMAVG